MIVTIELPDDFHILNIGLVDDNDKHAVTRSFTKCELIEKAEYIEKSEFMSFPADAIDDTVPKTHKCGDWDEENKCCVNTKLYDGYDKCPDDESCKLFWEDERNESDD